MSRYIDVDAFRDFEISRCGRMPIIGTDSSNNVPLGPELFRFPVADVVEVKHGEWELDNDGYYRCTCCNARARWTYDRARQDINVNYCCNCGAKMRKMLNDNG